MQARSIPVTIKSLAHDRSSWILLLAGLLTVIVYFPGLYGDYVFDDMPNLLDNKRLDMEVLDYDSLRSATLSSNAGPLRRPVSMLSFALNRYFFGIHPFSHKVINLAIHLLTGLALFILGRLLVKAYQRQSHGPRLTENTVRWLPLVITSLWLVHPLNLTSVLYIIQRMTSLAALFTVCGLCTYVAGRLRLLAGKPGRLLILAGFLVFGALAVFSKESGVLLALFMFIIELTLFRFRNSAGQSERFIVGLFVVFLLLPACLVLLKLALNPGWILNGYEVRTFTLSERLLTEARVLMLYLKLTVMPTTSTLGLYQGDIPLSRGLLSPATTLYSLLTIAALFVSALALLKRQPLISLGILWFFCAHSLESTIFPLEIAHEHRNYLADFGILLALGSAITVLPMQKLGSIVRAGTPLLFLCMFSYTTWLRADQWSDNVKFAVFEALHHPQSFRAVYSAGRIHAKLALNGQPGSEEQAFRYLEQASDVDDTKIMPAIVMIKLAYLLDKPVRQEWFTEVLERLERYPITPTALDSLSELSKCTGKRCTFPTGIMDEMFRLTLENPSLVIDGRLRAEAETIYGYYTINTH
ncbi:MAG: hypothetical protein JRG79_17990, partial [Deltaproteobacteria bacterium]|nr:hypothetical protein [Deltaproteobacteria bacterium]